MADLFIDGDALSRTRTTLENIRQTLEGAAGAMAEVPGDVTGHGGLQQRLTSFGSEWQHGIGQLAEVSGSGAEALQAIAETFDTADAELATVLDAGPEPGPGANDGPVPL